jgi:hypothetical protein
MPRTYVTDLTHFDGIDDPDLEIPGPARRIGLYFRAITEQASSAPPETVAKTAVACRARPGRRVCPGRIVGWRDSDPPSIRWWCPHCGENGLIHNWLGTRWDRSGSVPAAAESSPDPRASTPATDGGQPDPDGTRADVAVARAILTHLNEVNGDGLLIDDAEYGVVVRAVVEGVEAHLLRSGVEEDVVASAVEELFAHARRHFVAGWLRQALEDELDVGRRVDEEEEARSARLVFDSMVRGRHDVRRLR